MERTIKVTGKGKLSVRPDITRLMLSLEGRGKEYNEILKLSSDSTELLRTVLGRYGFKGEDLKTVFFNIDSIYESYQDKDGIWKQRFEGYRFSHELKVEFPVDNERLGRILYALGHSEITPGIRIEYGLSDPESAKKELLRKAVEDSAAKARILSDAAAVSLGEIVTIDYSWAEMEFISRPMNKMMLCADEAAPAERYDMNIEADDIVVTDTVTVVWRIE